jgi:hypothetical protein
MRRNRKEKDGQGGKHWTDIVSFFLTVFSVLIGTWAFVKSCDNENDLAEVNYKLAAVEHRPMIRFYNPTLIGLSLTLDTTGSSKKQLRNDTVDVKSNLQRQIRFRYKNIGNSNAKILGYVLTDTITDKPVLKDYIRNKARHRQTSNDSIFSKYEFHELAPLDSSEITFSHTLQFVENNAFVIHFIIYYENELGQRYDTYYWVKGKLKDFGFAQTIDPLTQKPVFILDRNEFWNIVSFIDENNYSSVYTVDERTDNSNYLEGLKTN